MNLIRFHPCSLVYTGSRVRTDDSYQVNGFQQHASTMRLPHVQVYIAPSINIVARYVPQLIVSCTRSTDLCD